MGTDRILVPSGAYTLSIAGRGENFDTRGDLDICSNLTLTGAGAGSITIDAAGTDRAIDVLASATATIEGGGGIRNQGTFTIMNSVITDNGTGSGGFGGSGIAGSTGVVVGTASVTGSSIDGNRSAPKRLQFKVVRP